MAGNEASPAAPRSFRRALLFRVLAILLGLTPFLAGELVCRWAGWGRTRSAPDPFVGFDAVVPLFELSDDGQRYEIPPHRQRFFAPESFAARKPADEFRIFCLGGSTVQGRPYSKETAFTTWLELSLTAADDSRRWQVVNCGGVSYASYRLLPILEEVLRYQPDLIVLCTGHNEFLEDRTYGHLKDRPAPLRATYRVLRHSRLFSAALHAWQGTADQSAESGRPLLPKEVDALLDYQGGLESYHRDDAWRDGVVQHFAWNVREMARLCQEHQVPLVLINPVSNWKDCPPFKVVVDESLPPESREKLETLWEEARQSDLPIPRRISLLQQVLAVDPRHAGALFLLGKSHEALGQYDEALPRFLAAKDQDVCPLRMLESMHEELRGAARRFHLPLVDVRERIAAESPGGIVGDEWMLDHVHPSIRGHQLMAEMLTGQVARLSGTTLDAGWDERRRERYRRHLGSLDATYFARGKERLEGLRRWTQGRVNQLREKRPPAASQPAAK